MTSRARLSFSLISCEKGERGFPRSRAAAFVLKLLRAFFTRICIRVGGGTRSVRKLGYRESEFLFASLKVIPKSRVMKGLKFRFVEVCFTK